MPEYSVFQRVSSELFGKTAKDLRRQLVGPVRLPHGITDHDLEKLDQIAKQAWMTGKGKQCAEDGASWRSTSARTEGKMVSGQDAKLELKRRWGSKG